jgi:hypothetical protein
MPVRVLWGKISGKRRFRKVWGGGVGGERWEVDTKSQDCLQCGIPELAMLK